MDLVNFTRSFNRNKKLKKKVITRRLVGILQEQRAFPKIKEKL